MATKQYKKYGEEPGSAADEGASLNAITRGRLHIPFFSHQQECVRVTNGANSGPAFQ